MATADELLSTLDTDKTLIIDKDLRTIIIPSSVKNLGVESDDDVLRLKFSMPRMYGDVDLSDFSIYINYMNAKNTGDVYAVDDKTIADDTITFSWLVGRVALAYKGNVRFIVCMKKHDGDSNVIQEYNTTIASLPVLEGLETGETVIQQNPDIIEMLLTLSEPLVGTTQTITPSQVLAAIKAGRDTALQYTDSYYGTFVFSAFNVNEKLGIVVSNSILPQMDGLTGTLLGFVEDAGWIFKATKTATKDDVPTKTSQLTNDSGFLTSHQDISSKQDKSTLEADVAAKGFTKNTGTYSKPAGGIPKSDLAAAVQTSLGKADTALQEHQSLAAYRTSAAQDIIDNGKQDKITSTNKLAYSLISGTPTIPTVPTNVSAFTNDAGYLTFATLPKYEGVVE